MTYEEAREASAAFVRSIDPNARRLWEMPGPKDTAIRQLESWELRTGANAEGVNRVRVMIVQVFGDRQGGDRGGGWAVLPEVGLNEIENTRQCLAALDALESDPTALTGGEL